MGAVREGLPEEMTLEQKEERALVMGRPRKKCPGRKSSTCKDPEVGISKVSVTGGMGGRHRGPLRRGQGTRTGNLNFIHWPIRENEAGDDTCPRSHSELRGVGV